MTVEQTSTYVRLAGNGVTTVFNFPFRIFDATDLVVSDIDEALPYNVPTVLINPTDYALTISSTGEGGSITVVTPIASGHSIDIRSSVELVQPTDIRNQGRFLPDIHEGVFDRLLRQVQTLSRKVTASLRYPDDGVTNADAVLPSVASRAGRYLSANAITGALEWVVDLAPTVLSQTLFNQFLNDALQFLFALVNPRSDLEIAAGVTPVSYQYLEGHVFRYMTSSQRNDVIAHTLLIDVTAPQLAAISVGCPVYWPDGSYLTTQSLALTNIKGFHWTLAKRAVIVNMASANKPTMVITDCQYFTIEGGIISGRSGFSNTGILLTTAGGQTSSFFKIRDIGLEPNGNGIEFIKLNTGQVHGVEYWPSGSLGVGSTRSAGQGKYAFLNSNTTGNYCNEVSFTACNAIGVNTAIAGHACFYLGGPNGVQGCTIADCELEGVGLTAIIASGAYNLKVQNCFLENSAIEFQNTRHCEIDTCYNPETVSFVTCVDTRLRNIVMGPVTTSFVISAGCSGCGAEHCEFQNAPSDGQPDASYFVDWSIAGVKQEDKTPSGIRQFGRSIANGISLTPTFAAGDYTATVGTWAVASGDVTDMTVAPIAGKRVQVDFDLRTTTTASNVTGLIFKIPGGYTAGPKDKWFEFTYSQDNGTTTLHGIGRVPAGGTVVHLYRDLAFTAYSNVTDLLLVRGSVVFEIA